MKNYDQSVEINYNPNWSYITENPYRILIIGGSGPGKTNVLLNVIKHQQPDIDIIYLYLLIYQLLIYGRESRNWKLKKF